VKRIVSLLPSATEIACILGCADQLVGVSHECDFPSEVRGRPVLTRSRIDVSGSSRSIDAGVREVIRGALSIYEIDDALLGSLSPDIVLTQDLCEVCAVSLDDVRAAVARLAHRTTVEIVSLRPTRLEHVLSDIERVAAALDLRDRGARVRGELQARIDAIAARARTAHARPRVVTLEWIDPMMIGGTWMPELVELAGGVAIGAHAGEPAPTIDRALLRELAPDVVVIKPCGFTLERTLVERDVIAANVLEAVPRTTRVLLTDGNAFFNRPGPRLVESLEIMAACVHPELFGDFAVKHKDVITHP